MSSVPLAPPRAGSSPHTRGARSRRVRRSRSLRIIPAYAGSTASRSGRQRSPRDHPRIRGEHFDRSVWAVLAEGSSPHTRGARRSTAATTASRRIIPAYAGSTLRGGAAVIGAVGSSPHTRGAQPGRRNRGDGAGIIPAYAGSTSRGLRLRRRLRDHPRIRGEHSNDAQSEAFSAGSSPHTRGAHTRGMRRPGVRGIIPAYAGSTGRPPAGAGGLSDHPRIRGEHGPRREAPTVPEGSSPHTRGAPLSPTRHTIIMGIIPAYAGSTGVGLVISAVLPDHPRIRGEHASSAPPV